MPGATVQPIHHFQESQAHMAIIGCIVHELACIRTPGAYSQTAMILEKASIILHKIGHSLLVGPEV